ncbi:MAG TPA: D-arabinono-1,4-lactone oxidase [Solirubrobacteraceae bacterium]|nr:D-arabinono-1,4-lactone oxidase [Solirubrobacteraceae bacterium]
MATSIGTNWSGNYAYRAGTLHRPEALEELQELVGGARSLRVIGSRHSFTSIADSAELVALDALPGEVTVDGAAQTVTVPGHTTYAALAEALNRAGLALDNLASLPHISVAGAIASGTHGSGDRKGNLATSVRAIEMVTADGELRTAAAGDPDFGGAVVALGALGAVTRVTLAVQPFYEMRQRVFESVSWETLFARCDAIFGAGDSVSVFHLCGERTEQVWVKRRVDDDRGGADEGDLDLDLEELLGVRAATAELHPVLGGDPVNCTQQEGVPGPWSERLPHFRSGFLPSSGEELQSEFFVARSDAVAAIQAVRGLAAEIVPLLLISELRTIAGDSLWLSPHQGRDSLALHFTWRRRPAEVEAVVERIEAALAPLAARAHWGKVFTARAERIAPLYPRMGDFRRLRDRLDPEETFVNDWLRDTVLSGP